MRVVDPLAKLKGVSPGEFEPDKAGYLRYRFSEKEREVCLEYLKAEIEAAEKADESRCEQILRNRKAYHAREVAKERVITLPVIKKDVNQQVANLVNAIMGKTPICTVRPEESGKTVVLSQDESGQPFEEEITTEEESEALQAYGEHLARRRIPFRKQVEAAVLDMCRGGMPYFKVTWDAKFREVKNRKVKRSIDQMTGIESSEVIIVRDKYPIDEPLRLEVIDGLDILMPPGQKDVQLAPWFAQRYELSPTGMRERFDDGRFDFGEKGEPEPERIEAIVRGVTQTFWQQLKEDAAAMVGLEIEDRAEKNQCYEIWFYWPRKDENGIEILSLCAQVSFAAEGEILSAYDNFYHHGRRCFIPCHQAPDPFENFSGSTADNLRPIQNLWTALYHITVKNGTQAITKAYKGVANSIGLRSLKEQNKGGGLPPGAVIEVGRPDEITDFQTGGSFGSLASEMGMLSSLASELSVVPQYQNIPNRTPTGTTQAVMSEAKAQGQQTLERVREALSEVFQMLIQVSQQFEPYGRGVPFQNPKTRAILEKYVKMPVNTVTDQFSFEITATSDEDTKPALRDAETVNLNLVREANRSIGEMVFHMLSLETPEFLEPITMQLILREEEQLKRVLKLAHKDFDEYTFDRADMQEWLGRKHEFREEQAREEAEAAAAAEAAEQQRQQEAAAAAAAQQQQAMPPPMPPEMPRPEMPPEMMAQMMAESEGGGAPPGPPQSGEVDPETLQLLQMLGSEGG